MMSGSSEWYIASLGAKRQKKILPADTHKSEAAAARSGSLCVKGLVILSVKGVDSIPCL